MLPLSLERENWVNSPPAFLLGIAEVNKTSEARSNKRSDTFSMIEFVHKIEIRNFVSRNHVLELF